MLASQSNLNLLPTQKIKQMMGELTIGAVNYSTLLYFVLLLIYFVEKFRCYRTHYTIQKGSTESCTDSVAIYYRIGNIGGRQARDLTSHTGFS